MRTRPCSARSSTVSPSARLERAPSWYWTSGRHAKARAPRVRALLSAELRAPQAGSTSKGLEPLRVVTGSGTEATLSTVGCGAGLVDRRCRLRRPARRPVSTPRGRCSSSHGSRGAAGRWVEAGFLRTYLTRAIRGARRTPRDALRHRPDSGRASRSLRVHDLTRRRAACLVTPRPCSRRPQPGDSRRADRTAAAGCGVDHDELRWTRANELSSTIPRTRGTPRSRWRTRAADSEHVRLSSVLVGAGDVGAGSKRDVAYSATGPAHEEAPRRPPRRARARGVAGAGAGDRARRARAGLRQARPAGRGGRRARGREAAAVCLARGREARAWARRARGRSGGPRLRRRRRLDRRLHGRPPPAGRGTRHRGRRRLRPASPASPRRIRA